MMLDSERIYAGIAVGGPMDGQVIYHNSPYYRAIDYAAIAQSAHEITPHNMNASCHNEVTIVEYRHNASGRWLLKNT